MSTAMDNLKSYKIKVESELEKFFDEKIKEALDSGIYAIDLYKNLKAYTLRGGKRLRAVFMVYGYKAFNGQNEQAIINASIALELMQGFLLIHDDIMDQDPLRRGGPAFHKIYESFANDKFPSMDNFRFGENVAIIGGDLMNNFGMEVLNKSGFAEHERALAMNKYNEITYITSFGQLLDLVNEAGDSFTEQSVLRVHEYKTSIYTIEGPLMIGGLLAGATPEQLKVFHEYGFNLGLAFQIQDDILGMFGDAKKLGKPADSDLKEGKKTLLVLKVLENGSEEQKKEMSSALGNQNVTQAQVEQARAIIKETGSYDYSKKLVKEYIAKSKSAIENSSISDESKEFLLGIADYMLNREY